MISNENKIANYERYHIRDVLKTARTLSPECKRQLLDKIQVMKGVHHLNGQTFNNATCARIEKLLKEES